METKTELSVLQEGLQRRLSAQAQPVSEAIRKIEATGSLLDDYVVPVQQLGFTNYYNQVEIGFGEGEERKSFWLHKHAIGQIAERFGIPAAYLTALVTGEKEWQHNLSTAIMTYHASNTARERVLMRVVEGQLRGFLSDRYKRMNSMEIFVAFLKAANEKGSILVDAHAGETKGYLEVINPEIVEFDTPLNGRQYAAFGSRIRNSDFGDGALDVRLFMLDVKCMNGLVGETMLRELHLGGRIPQDIIISEDTYRKETAAKAALVGDIMNQITGPDTVNGMIKKIEGASSKLIDIPKEIERLPKLGYTVGESKEVERVLIENDPANGVQGSPTLWKLVSAMTAVARDAEPQRKRELEEIASSMIR